MKREGDCMAKERKPRGRDAPAGGEIGRREDAHEDDI